MGGFGSGPFGQNPAGQADWARNVLFDTIPQFYQKADVDNGHLLERLQEGLFPSFDNLREHIRQYGDLRDPFLVRTAWSEFDFLTLGKQIIPTGAIEQTGAQARVYSSGTFTAQDRTTRFSPADIGKQIIIRRSSVQTNNQQTFTISGFINEKEVFTDPLIAVDAGPMRWELRPAVEIPVDEVEVELRGGDPRLVEIGWQVFDGAKQFTVLTRQMYYQSVLNNQQLNEREFKDGEVDAAGTVGSPSYTFTQTDIGKLIFLGPLSDGASVLTEIGDVEAGRAVVGRLVVPGTLKDPFGKITYAYRTTADRPVTILHSYEALPNLPLVVSFQSDAISQERFDITVRLATDAGSNITTIPSDIVTAIGLNPTITKYVEVYRTVTPGVETTVAAFDRAPIKGLRLPETAGPFFWAVRPFARITLRGGLPLGVVSNENFDLEVLPNSGPDPLHPTPTTTRVFSPSASFEPTDIGKLLSIHGSVLGNDGCYEIMGVNSAGDRAFVKAFLRADPSVCYWEIRSAPIIRPDPTRLNPLDCEVQAHAQALLDIFARDFGVEVDTQQVDDRQRAWVRQVSQWIAVKGTAQSVIDVAHLSGFSANVLPLFTVVAAPGTSTSAGFNYIYIADPGRSRLTGTITNNAGFAEFSDPTQSFVASDVGRVLNTGNSASVAPVNNNFWVIGSIISPTVVRLLQPSIGANLGPIENWNYVEPNNGLLTSSIGQLFTTVVPTFPRMDDVDLDYVAVMADIQGRTAFNRPGIDVMCDVEPIIVGSTLVDPDALSSSASGSTITAISSVLNTHTLTITGDDISVYTGGDWQFTDSAGNIRFLDAPPTLVSLGAPVLVPYVDLDAVPQIATTYPNAVYTVTTQSTVPPVVGPVAFTYICNIILDCNICATYRVLIELTKTAKLISEGALANDQAFERVQRLIDDTLPVNAEPIYVLLP